MRALFFALCLCLTIAPAAAQSKEPSVAAITTPSEATITAARDFMSLLIVESGAVDRAMEKAFSDLLPVLMRQMETAPFYQRLSAERRAAFSAYFNERYPLIVGDMIRQGTPRILDDAAAQLAPLFSEQEMVDIAAFARSEPARSVLVRMVLLGVEGKGDDESLSPQEEAAFTRFAETPSGQALEQRLGPALELLGPSIESGFNNLVPALQARVATDICALLESDCPPALRAMAPI